MLQFSLLSVNYLRVPEICDRQRFETGARVSKKIPTTHVFLHQIMVMASGVRDSSKNSRGLFLQLRNVSSADLLWDEKKVEKES